MDRRPDYDGGYGRVNFALDRVKDQNVRSYPWIAISIQVADDFISKLGAKFLDTSEHRFRQAGGVRIPYHGRTTKGPEDGARR
jgi:hypothetical protein